MEIKLLYITIVLIILRQISVWGINKYRSGLRKKIFKELLEWMNSGLWAVLIAFFVMSFIIQAFKIPSGSMENTLLINDHLFANKFIYGIRVPFNKEKRILRFTKPKRGDIIIFEYPNDTSIDYVKRCIGLPGNTVEIKNKMVYINGKLIDEPYAVHKDPYIYPDNPDNRNNNRDNYGPIVIPQEEYFMMGDNRDNSSDSRCWGTLPEKYIKGKPLIKYWPLTRVGLIK